jgi:hypothetical protein
MCSSNNEDGFHNHRDAFGRITYDPWQDIYTNAFRGLITTTSTLFEIKKVRNQLLKGKLLIGLHHNERIYEEYAVAVKIHKVLNAYKIMANHKDRQTYKHLRRQHLEESSCGYLSCPCRTSILNKYDSMWKGGRDMNGDPCLYCGRDWVRYLVSENQWGERWEYDFCPNHLGQVPINEYNIPEIEVQLRQHGLYIGIGPDTTMDSESQGSEDFFDDLTADGPNVREITCQDTFDSRWNTVVVYQPREIVVYQPTNWDY